MTAAAGWSRRRWTAHLPTISLVAAVGVAALVRPAAPIVLFALLLAYPLARWRRLASSSLAAVLPAATILAWRSIGQPAAAPDGLDCANILSTPAMWRLLEALAGLFVLLALVIDRRASLAGLGFHRGSRRVRALALVVLLVLGPIAIYAGTVVGQGSIGGVSLFGAYQLDFSQPLALLPALIFAGSNALAEELAYRGAMRTWLVPALGVTGANAAQAIVFGLAHTGEDFTSAAAVIPTMLAMMIAGFVGGVIARRT
ncbi:MAG TPA: CPBP family intramembrane glutamic endopeptidase, partial [Candidatus Limnocylindrales bacterium]|nr:CPBP family intramembrane glutamic endopeptidase [Candidatus Limnocylindrales bacterium]